MTEVNAEIITPFGPSIFKVKIPNQIVDDLNQYVDNTVADETKANKLNHGDQLIGDVTQEFKLEEEFMKQVGWLGFLGNCTSNWIQNVTGKKIKNFALIDSWIVRQFENEYNPIHYHTGHISGAGFLKLPSTFGTHVQEKEKEEKDYFGGTLNLVHGQKSFLSESVFSIKPEVGYFYFFPHYLMHTVYPFKDTSEERRSISFNAKIDNEIFEML